jgi:hypothetical protein
VRAEDGFGEALIEGVLAFGVRLARNRLSSHSIQKPLVSCPSSVLRSMLAGSRKSIMSTIHLTRLLLPLRRATVLALFSSLAFCLPGSRTEAQQLIHQYSFDNDARDSVGGADGTLVGNAFVANGAVVLDGSVHDYVDLPNDLVLNLTNATFEAWVTWDGGPAWQRVFDFGNNENGEDLQANATQNIFLTPNNGSGLDLSIYTNGIGGQQVLTGTALSTGVVHHVVWTLDSAAKTGKLYVDGSQVNVNTKMTYTLASLGSTVNDWLGHSQYPQDPGYSGSILEFRIYDGPLSAGAVLTNYLIGPNPAGRGALESIALIVQPTMRPGSGQQIRVVATYANIANIEVTGDSNVTYKVSDSTLLSVNTNGLLKAVGPGNGSATVTASYLGQSASQTIQVLPPKTPTLLHRYSFDSDASDSVGGANGQLMSAIVTNGAAVLSGKKPSYVSLPANLVTNITDTSFEMWITWNGGGPWQRIFDFGNSGAAAGQQGAATQSIFLTPNNGNVMDLSIFPNGIGGQQVINSSPLSVGKLHHIVWTYDALATTARLYVDAKQVGSNSNMTYTLAGLGSTDNNWLGHSQYTQDSDFAGSIAEFRIYDAALSPEMVQTNFVTGPNPNGTGALLSISLAARPAMLPDVGQQLIVSANYENVNGVDVTTNANLSFQVSDPKVLTVNASGFVTPIASPPASSTITASFQGKTASQLIQIVAPKAPVLLHRYSFTSDASDSVGHADGQLVGDASITNHAVLLSGNKPSYVDLPNDLVSNLTDVTFEVWLTWNGGAVWQRIWDFGNNDVGEDMQGTATQSIFLTPDNGSVMDLSIFANGIGVQQVINSPQLSAGVPHHLVWSYSAVTTTARLFQDGVEVGNNTSMTNTLQGLGSTVNNWLGHSQYIQDPDLAASIDEFRIYDGTYLGADAAADFQAGPDTLASDAASRRLSVALSGNQILISWPTSGTTFTLQSSGSLGGAANWNAVGTNPTVSNGQNQVTVQASGTATFYRLKQP